MSIDNKKYIIVQMNQCKCVVKAIKIQESISGKDIFKIMKEKFDFQSPFRWSIVTSKSTKKLNFEENTRLRYDGFGENCSS